MYHVPTTPFGQRPYSGGLIEPDVAVPANQSMPDVDKYTLLDDLRMTRASFGLSDRDLAVLAALLSFHSGRTLAQSDDLIVFPSNKTLSDRAHGMAESTLRRHLATLVNAGLIRRNDSPNGKRYAARNRQGVIVRAFGFDLRPLCALASSIAVDAEAARDAALTLRRLREDVVLMIRDASKLVAYLAEMETPYPSSSEVTAKIQDVRAALRRNQDLAKITELRSVAMSILSDVSAHLEPQQTPEMSGSDAQNERHQQNSNKEQLETETPAIEPQNQNAIAQQEKPNLPLSLVLKACPDIELYAKDGRITHWHQLVATGEQLHRMMGIPRQVWTRAKRIMGVETAAVTLSGMLQRVAEIRSPGGYLTALTKRAETKGFSPGPMIMALLGGPASPALAAQS